jgi:hypothetical protein
MKNYSLKSCELLIDKFVNEFSGEATILSEGILGLGTVLLHSAKGKKTVVIKEYYITSWTSGHSVIKYNKIPKKYQNIIDNL